jgi:hypothetical protein
MQQGVKYTMQKKALGTSLRAGVDDVQAKDYQQLRAETDVTSIEMRRDCSVDEGCPGFFRARRRLSASVCFVQLLTGYSFKNDTKDAAY